MRNNIAIVLIICGTVLALAPSTRISPRLANGAGFVGTGVLRLLQDFSDNHSKKPIG